jgi:hypothetical protein
LAGILRTQIVHDYKNSAASRLPGRRNFSQKAKKGREKIKLSGRICDRSLAKFFQKWQKRGRRKFAKEVPYLVALTHFQK